MSKMHKSSSFRRTSNDRTIGGSSNSSSPSNHPRKQIRRCCRNFVTFMCTQVGVGALIVFYAICGAFSFMHIEGHYNNKTTLEVAELRKNCSQKLWNITEKLNTFDRMEWEKSSDVVLQQYQRNIVEIFKNGYDGRRPDQIWSLPAALMFCLSVITMIGYGNMVPRTPWGKIFTMIYATFGIPLYILYFLSIGRVLARAFKFLYRSLHNCTQEAMLDGLETNSIRAMQQKKVFVPSTACLWVMILYILTGTFMFAKSEDWSLLNSFYFCMTSICKIGFGDFVPGDKRVVNEDVTNNSHELAKLLTDQNYKLAINFIYILIGMSLVAMCYNLMREEVRVKLKEMKEDTKLCLEDTRARFFGCCGNREDYDDDYY